MEGVGLAVCVAVLEGVGVRVLDLVRVAVRELLGEGEPVLLPLLLGVGRWDGVGNAVRVVESVGDGEPENVSLGVTVLVAASVGKAVRVGESEGTGAPEHVGVPVEAAVPLADPVGLDGGVPAGEVDGVGLAAHEPEEHPPSVPNSVRHTHPSGFSVQEVVDVNGWHELHWSTLKLGCWNAKLT